MAFLIVFGSIVGQIAKYVFGHDYLMGFVPLFYVDNEANIPTFFSMALLLLASLLLAVITFLSSKVSRQKWYWAFLSCGFLYMAYDEGMGGHERLIYPIREWLFADGKAGIFYFAWVIPGIAIVILLAFFFLKFWLQFPAPVRNGFLISASLYLGGAILVELVGGYYTESVGTGNLVYSMIATLEESLEMAGAITFLWVLLKYLRDNHAGILFRFSDQRI